jgi:sn-glycerol 3-phosphate transport system substrate-binding protein
MITHASRTRSILAVVAIFLVVTAACSSSSDDSTGTDAGSTAELPTCSVDSLDDASGPVEVVVWHSYVAKTKDTLEKLVAQYNAEQSKVRVRVESQGNSYEELWSKYQQSAQTGDLPAIAIVEDTATQAIVDSGTVLPAQSCIDAADYDTSDLVQSGIDYYSIDGVFYPGTINMSSPLLYFNANHFRAAGLDPADPPTTLDELRDTARAIKDAGVAPTPLVMNLSSWYIETWLTGEGAPMVDNDNGRGDGETTEAAFDDDQTLSVMQWIKGMYDDGLLQAIPLVPGKVDHLFALQAQNGSMTFETSTAATSIKAFLGGDQSVAAEAGGVATANVSGLDIQAAKIPGVTEAGQVQIGGGAWYMTSELPPEVQSAAWDFLTWWNRPETQVVWTTEGSYIPFSTTAAQSPEVQQFWTDDLAGRWIQLSYEQLSEGVDPDWPGPLVGPYPEMRKAIEGGLDALTLEGADPQAVIDKAAQATDDAITNYNQGNF